MEQFSVAIIKEESFWRKRRIFYGVCSVMVVALHSSGVSTSGYQMGLLVQTIISYLGLWLPLVSMAGFMFFSGFCFYLNTTNYASFYSISKNAIDEYSMGKHVECPFTYFVVADNGYTYQKQICGSELVDE